MFRGRNTGAVVMVIGLALACGASAAQAAFPGANGKIAYTDGNSLFTVNPDGSGAARIPTSDNCGRNGLGWSATGSLLATTCGGQIAILGPDGSGYHKINDNFNTIRLDSWSPDSRKLVYWGSCGNPCSDVYTINADGTGFTRIASGALSNFPIWSPGGDTIAVARSDGIYTMTPPGTNVRKIPGTVSRDYPDSWSPDGYRIAFTRNPALGQDDIFVVNVDGSGLRQITSDGLSLQAAWSPDGTKIAFTSARDGHGEIYVMNVDGSAQTRLSTTTTGVTTPDWQPIPYTGYPRPRGATPLRVSLVPAFNRCTSPNTTHGPPLSYGSCRPTQFSPNLTVGTPDTNGEAANSIGAVLMRVFYCPLCASPINEDLFFSVTLTDVRNAGDLSDYGGELQTRSVVRITDKANGPAEDEAATVQDFDFAFTVPCAKTDNTSIGSTCSVDTSLQALHPGAVKEGKRAIWGLGAVRVYDGGPDGVASTSDNSVVAAQGVFIP